MDWLHSLIRRSPGRALVLGKALFLAGAILVLGAVFARAGLAVPRYAAWIVPEAPVGYAIAALLVLAGMALIVLAEKA
jgi:hypothetical protein